MFTIEDLKGIIPPIVTPVTIEEAVDYDDFKNVIEYVIEGGVHGIFPLGSNGEFYAHDFKTKVEIMEFVINQVNGRVPVYCGVTDITTKGAIALAKEAERLGADAVSLLPPMFIQLNEDELYNHFKSVADAIKIPVILYNNPGKVGNDISIKLLKKLAQIDNIWGIKNTTLNFAQSLQYIEATKNIENFKILSGIDYYIFSSLCNGNMGAVAGTANVAPKLVVEIYEKYISGDLKGSLEAQQKLMPLRDAFGIGTFPVVGKDCLKLMGIIKNGAVKPVTSCNEENLEKLKNILKNLKLIK